MSHLRNRPLVAIAGLAVISAAFVWLPAVLVGGATTSGTLLRGSTADAIAAYWHEGRAPFTDDLRELVDQWRDYHMIKAVVAGVAVVVLVRAAVRAGRRASNASRTMLAGAGVAVIALGALTAVLLLIANVQGAIAPFASLLSLLPTAASNGRFASTSREISDALTQRASSGHRGPPPLDRMVDSFVGFHVVLAALAGAIAMLTAWLIIRRLARGASGPAASHAALHRIALAGAALSCAAAVVLCLANVSTARRPVPALRDVFASTAPTRSIVERQRGGQLSVRLDVVGELGDLAFGECDDVGAGDEPSRRRLLA